jgi:hypothetical protein
MNQPIEVEPMTAHALAKVLLSLPDKLVSTHANNHTFNSNPSFSGWGVLKVREEEHRILIGNFFR